MTELLPKQLEKDTGIKMTGVTFRGTGPAIQEIVAGRLDFAVSPLAIAMPLYAEKKIKIIGMTSPDRLPIASEVPTLKEQGVNIVNYGWWGVCAASGTPWPVIEKINRHVQDAVASEDYKSTMSNTGAIPISTSIDEFGRMITETASEAAKMFKDLGIEQIDQ